jgi:hypothetical protein
MDRIITKQKIMKYYSKINTPISCGPGYICKLNFKKEGLNTGNSTSGPKEKLDVDFRKYKIPIRLQPVPMPHADIQQEDVRSEPCLVKSGIAKNNDQLRVRSGCR